MTNLEYLKNGGVYEDNYTEENTVNYDDIERLDNIERLVDADVIPDNLP